MIRRCFFACGLLLAGLWQGASGQSLYGSTGLVFSPTADVTPYRSVQVGLSTFDIKRGNITRHWWSGGVAVGLAERLEVGGVFLHQTGTGRTRSSAGGFAKYQLQSETLMTPSLAVGADMIGGDIRTSQYYLVATKGIAEPVSGRAVKLTGGIMHVRDRDGTRRDSADAFAGLSYPISDQLTLVGEWRSKTKNNRRDSTGIVLMYGQANYKVAIGWVNSGTSDRHRLFIGAGFNLSSVD